jgi:PRTRC genetic system protein E
MFTELLPILQERSVTVQLTLREGKVAVMVAPKKAKEDENPAYWTPFSACATAAELDAGFAQMLQNYVAVRSEVTVSLSDALTAAADAMKKAADEAKKKAGEKLKKPVPKLGAPTATAATTTATAAAPKTDTEDDEDNGGEGESVAEAAAPAAVVAEEAPQVSLF